jgi:hypothetical protein
MSVELSAPTWTERSAASCVVLKLWNSVEVNAAIAVVDNAAICVVVKMDVVTLRSQHCLSFNGLALFAKQRAGHFDLTRSLVVFSRVSKWGNLVNIL